MREVSNMRLRGPHLTCDTYRGITGVCPNRTSAHVERRLERGRVEIQFLRTFVFHDIHLYHVVRVCGRGVRVVASAHGDLQSLLKNPELNSLVGGTTTVTLGDAMAQSTNGGNKVRVATLWTIRLEGSGSPQRAGTGRGFACFRARRSPIERVFTLLEPS